VKTRIPLFAASAVLLAPTLAHADVRRPLHLSAGPLGDAIVALSRDTGASIRLADAGLWQRPVHSVDGRMTVRKALDRMLAGSGARPVAIGGESWQIVRDDTPPRHRHSAPEAGAVPPDDAIIVNASKRGTRLSDFPGTVSILSGTDLGPGPADSDTITNRASSVSSTHLGAGRDKLFIRGVADSGLVGQSQATVGQYLGDIRLSYNAPDPDLRLYDVAAIEVLEGPQGTLYGAGSPGGIIRIVRNDPVLGHFEGAATMGLSTVAHGAAGADGSAMLNLPLADDHVALRLVGYASTDGGYIDNLATGRDNVNRTHTEGGRAVLRVAPGDGWTIDFGVTTQDIHGDDSQYADRDTPPLTRRSLIPQPYDDDYRMGEITIAKDWGGLRFTSSTAIIRQSVAERFDATFQPGYPRLYRQWNRTSMVTTENRLTRPVTNGFGWMVGTSFLHNSAQLTRALGPLDGVSPTTGVLNRINETTVFGEASVEPFHGLTLTAGGRITYSRLSGRALDLLPEAAALPTDPRIQGERSETKFLPSLSASVKPGDGVILFTRYQQGFRPGGLTVGNEVVRRFQSDRVATAELGVRYDRPGDGAISIAASIAHTDWRDIQADFLDADGLPVTTNIGDGRIWSFDATVAVRLLQGLRIEGSIVVNNSKLTRPDVTQLRTIRLLGNGPSLFPGGPVTGVQAPSGTTEPSVSDVAQQLPNVANLGGRLGIDYHRALASGWDISVGGWGRYVGKSRLGIGPILGGKEGNYVDTGATLRIGKGRYGATLSVTNLLDTVGNRFALGTPLDVVRSGEITPLQPRTFRLGLDAHF
jgi:outer membrane receptor protein involved in Fe transport